MAYLGKTPSNRPPPPEEWKPGYPTKLDSLDKFWAKEYNIGMDDSKRWKRPRSDTEKEKRRLYRENRERREAMNFADVLDELEYYLEMITALMDDVNVSREDERERIVDDLKDMAMFGMEIRETFEQTDVGLPMRVFHYGTNMVEAVNRAKRRGFEQWELALLGVSNAHIDLSDLVEGYRKIVASRPVPPVSSSPPSHPPPALPEGY